MTLSDNKKSSILGAIGNERHEDLIAHNFDKNSKIKAIGLEIITTKKTKRDIGISGISYRDLAKLQTQNIYCYYLPDRT